MGALESENSLLIHIPAHDGRGFGVAPKAETEIYKRGGIGRVNRTEPLDTVQAAILLYRTGNFDIRTYEGCARLLISNDIWSVDLLTDNKFKIQSMESFGVAVNRRKTNTDKQACRNHIMAKKNYKNYFPD
jgi:GTP cyclohydrolase II